MGMIAQFIRVDDDKLAVLQADPTRIHEFVDRTGFDSQDVLDIDKSWAAINFLLTSEAWGGDLPLGFILAGPPIGDEDIGMGPALAKRASTVKTIATALETITEETIRERFNHEEMIQEEIYAMGGDAADDLEYVVQGFTELRKFVLAASESGSGLIHYIC